MNASKFLKYIIPSLAGLLIFGLILLSGCNKDKNSYVSYHRGVNASQQFVYAQQMMKQLLNTYFKSLTDSAFLASGTANIDGAKVQYHEDTLKKILIEYPSYGADDGFGHWRMGTYEAQTHDDFFKKDALIHFVFNDFSYDKDTLTVDSLILQNLGKTDGLNEQYYIKSGDITVDYELSDYYSIFRLDEYFKRIKDPSSKYTSPEDKYEIWGALNGLTDLNVQFESSIVEDSALMNAFSCAWLKQGPVTVLTENFGYVSTVYFAPADSCENNYLIEINGNPFPFPIDE
jgi:hypothetical protein